MRAWIAVLGVALVATEAPPPAAGAAEPPDAAVVAVRRALSAALAVVDGEGSRDEKLGSLWVLTRELLDTRAMGRRAMGSALSARPPEEQEEYLELFDHLIVRAYLQKLLLFRKPHFEYDPPRQVSGVVLVQTRIVTGGDDYTVSYPMRDLDGRWVAEDVIIEGVSLTQNYRAQFASLLRGRSFEELLGLMRRKTRATRKGPQ